MVADHQLEGLAVGLEQVDGAHGGAQQARGAFDDRLEQSARAELGGHLQGRLVQRGHFHGVARQPLFRHLALGDVLHHLHDTDHRTLGVVERGGRQADGHQPTIARAARHLGAHYRFAPADALDDLGEGRFPAWRNERIAPPDHLLALPSRRAARPPDSRA